MNYSYIVLFFYFLLFLIYNYIGDKMRKKVYLLSIIFFIIDLLSKVFILKINVKMPYTIIKNFFYIDLVSNNGAAFSILSGGTLLFIIIAIIVLFYIDRYIVTDTDKYLYISLVIGGIIGNLFDRIVYGSVIDFLSFKFGTYYFPIFNLADVFICTGIFLLAFEYLRGGHNENKS